MSVKTPCIRGDGFIGPKGYVIVVVAGRMRSAHRVAYERAKGPIPPKYDVDHLCRNRWCENPDHLEAITHWENLLRANAAKTHCVRGHLLNRDNIYLTKDGRQRCRACGLSQCGSYRLRPEARARDAARGRAKRAREREARAGAAQGG